MTTTPETIAELRKLLAEATQGEWQSRHWHTDDLTVVHVGTSNLATMTTEDGDLTTAAVNALPSLLSDLDAVWKREQVLREAILRVQPLLSKGDVGNVWLNYPDKPEQTPNTVIAAALAATEGK